VAFEALVSRYQDLALRVAYVITGDASVADDVAQESFIKAFRALHRFRRDAPFRPWLLKIVANEARNMHKGTARREKLVLQAAKASRTSIDLATPEQAALAAEQREKLLLALNELPDADRLVISSRYLFSLSEAETATLLGCPKGTVKSRLARALGKLRRNLEQETSALPQVAGRATSHD
jgi:RNA polymerase sigma factor (sigma-70 family)